jgi:hypothetical protein
MSTTASHIRRQFSQLLPPTCKIRPLLPLLMLMASLALVRAQGTIGNPQFVFTTNNGVLTLTKYNGQGGHVVVPGSMYGLTVVGIDESTNGVPVFQGLVFSISIPSSITNISDAVLARCFFPIAVDPLNPSYSSVGGSLYSSDQTTLIRSGPPGGIGIPIMGKYYTVASNVMCVADTAFQNWSGLSGVFFQGDAPCVGPSAFAGATNVTVYYPAGMTGWGPTFGGRPSLLFDPLFPFTYAVNNGAITITGYTLNGGTIAIPETMYGLPVAIIADSAFSALAGSYPTSITIGNTVTNIGAGAFMGCRFMYSVSIGANVVSIGRNAFYGCDELTSVEIPDSVTEIGESAFDGCGLNHVRIGNGVTAIAPGTFASCSSLTQIEIPSRVSSIGFAAFVYCENLTTVVLGESVAFIGTNVFWGCGSLSGVYFRGDAPAVDSSAFYGDNNATMYYLPGGRAWGLTIGERPTALWRPQIQTDGSDFGMRTNQFGFNISWASGMTIAVDACASLASPSWMPLQTNTLTADSFYFSDPDSTNYPTRFYRVRWP